MNQSIAILEPRVAAKIAAGEVIERPSAVVRELLDNAIDAGATQISLYLEDGGLQLIRVRDNGIGMSREDLELCFRPHATSKIRQADDLLRLGSLGFRGEALGSIAACSKLRISSAQQEQADEHSSSTAAGQLTRFELRVSDSVYQGIQAASAAGGGTQVEVRELFYSFPARRKFLKSARAEYNSCKAVFSEKALAFGHIHFRCYNHGKLESSLTPATSAERICQVYGDLVTEQLQTLEDQAEHFRVQLFAAPPQLYRRDRKRMPLYINQRPIVESSLQQAIRLGYDGYLAGGLFPVCFCFLEVAPDRVDFNIHPAKREARLRDLSLIQAAIRQTLRSFCRQSGALAGGTAAPDFASQRPAAQGAAPTEAEPSSAGRAPQRYAGRSFVPASARAGQAQAKESGASALEPGSFSARELTASEQSADKAHWQADKKETGWQVGQSPGRAGEFCYLGQLFEVFLLVERRTQDTPQLLIVDQHASHERILYETLEREMLQPQPLLVPIELEVNRDEETSLGQRGPALASIGIQLAPRAAQETTDAGATKVWQITSLPPSVSDLKSELVELILHGASEAEDLKRELFAHLSCHKAIKKGDILDDISAVELLQSVFDLGLERCPHGRPLWYSLSQAELYRLLQRT